MASFNEGDHVIYNTGTADTLAHVLADNGDGTHKLAAIDPDTAAQTLIPKSAYREPKDYGPEGGGGTFRKLKR